MPGWLVLIRNQLTFISLRPAPWANKSEMPCRTPFKMQPQMLRVTITGAVAQRQKAMVRMGPTLVYRGAYLPYTKCNPLRNLP